MSQRHFLVIVSLLLGAAPMLEQQTPTAKEAEAPQASTLPAVIEVELVLVQWATNPPEAGKETPNELSGSIDEVQQRLSALQKARKLTVLDRFRLTTLDGKQAMVQSGASMPMTQGVTISPYGTTRNVVDQHVGTIVMVKPEVVARETIQMELGFGKSTIATRPDAPLWVETKQGEKIAATGTAGIDLQTVLRVASGKTTVVTRHSRDGRHHLLIVSATAR